MPASVRLLGGFKARGMMAVMMAVITAACMTGDESASSVHETCRKSMTSFVFIS
jgi:hypothetical protein